MDKPVCLSWSRDLTFDTGSVNGGLYVMDVKVRYGYNSVHGPRGAHGNGFIYSCNTKFISVLSLRFKYCLSSFFCCSFHGVKR